MDESKCENKQIENENLIEDQKTKDNKEEKKNENENENEKENENENENEKEKENENENNNVIYNKNDIDNQSQSIEKEKNEKKVNNKEKEKEIEIEIQEINDIKTEKEEHPIIKEEKLAEKKQPNQEEKKEEINTKKEEKKENKNVKKEKMNIDIVKEPNKEPNIGHITKYQINPSKYKIKNKSIETKMKTLLNKDDEKNETENKKGNENTFMNKLKDLKRELSKKEEIYNSKKLKFKSFKNFEENKRYTNYINNNNIKSVDFIPNIKNLVTLNEKKYKDLKNKYYFSLNNKKNLFLDNEKPIINYNRTIKKPYNKTFRFQNYISNSNPILYTKNIHERENDKKNNEIIRLINSNDNFEVILQKLKKTNNIGLNIIKNEKIFNKNNILYNSSNINQYKSYYKKYNSFNSSKSDNNKKLQNLINDVFQEIRNRNINSYIFKSRLSTITSKLRRYDEYTPTKRNNNNFDYLLNLCSKVYLKKYSQSHKKSNYI